jgi:hypothetical protein
VEGATTASVQERTADRVEVSDRGDPAFGAVAAPLWVGETGSPHLPPQEILRLQRTIGNAATARRLGRQSTRPASSIQRSCGCVGACECGAGAAPDLDEGSVAPGLAVQRSGDPIAVNRLELPSGLIDQVSGMLDGVTSMFTGGDRDVAAATSAAATSAASMQGQLLSQAGTLQSQADTTVGAQVVDAQDKTNAAQSEANTAQHAAADDGLSFASILTDVKTFLTPGVLPAGAAGTGPVGAPTRGDVEDQAREADGQIPELDCDSSSLISGLQEGMGRLLPRVKAAAGRAIDERLAQLRETYGGFKAWLQRADARLLSTVSRGVRESSRMVGETVRRIGKTLGVGIETVSRGFATVVEGAGAALDGLVTSAGRGWRSLKSTAGRVVDRLIGAIRGHGGGIIARARRLLGRVWSLVPDFVKSKVASFGRRLTSLVEKGRERLAALEELAGKAVNRLRQAVRSKWQTMKDRARRVWQGAQAAAARAVDTMGKGADVIAEAMEEKAQDLRQRSAETIAETRAPIQAGLEQREGEMMGELCAPLSGPATACADDMLPDLGEGSENEVKFYLKGHVDIPIRGFNVRVGEGASISIKRVGDKFTVTLEGTANLAANVTANTDSDPSVEAEVEAGGASSNLVDAFKALAGQSADPIAAKGRAEAGIRGTVSGAFDFDKGGDDSTCDGIGGMVTFLGALGGAGLLPAPFGSMAAGGVVGAFADNASSLKFRLATYGEAEGEASAVGAVDIKGGLSVERYVEMELSLTEGDDGERQASKQSVTLGEILRLSAETKLGLPGIVKLIQGGLTGSAEMALKLTYDYATDELGASELKQEAKLTAMVSESVLWALAEVVPGSAMQTVSDRLDELDDDPSHSGTFGVELTLTNLITGGERVLVNLVQEVQTYMESEGSSVSRGGVMAVVERLLNGVQFSSTYAVKMIEADKISAKLAVSGGTGKGGASVEAGMEQTRSRQIASGNLGS